MTDAAECAYPLLVPLVTGRKMIGVSHTGIYRLIARGQIRAVKVGSRTMIPVTSLRAYVASLPDAAIAIAA